MTQVHHHHAELGDVRLHFVTAGSGAAVVLLHGWPQTWFCWRKVIPLLAEGHLVVAPDLRGLGDSSRPSSGYDKRTVSGDVHRLMHDELGIDEFHLAGHDWGGVTAYSLAAHHPESVAALAVIDVTIPGLGATDISQGGRRWHHAFHRTPGLPEALVAGREDVYLGWFYRSFGYTSDAISDDEVREYLRTYSQPDALRAGFEYYRATPQDIADNAALAGKGALPMPVLAIGGAGGWGRGREVADSLRQFADQVHDVVIDEAGHWIPEEQPRVLADHLTEFFARR
ncbi:alpha/beta fold hydrolase [Pseudonocardia adelaidensis]|uniref:Alpha/beta fold hydrolase n=1 Tax=Pseudonocardia adelaidensis TaxID=648754 RepID=A0ABP9ND60_9PSEU